MPDKKTPRKGAPVRLDGDQLVDKLRQAQERSNEVPETDSKKDEIKLVEPAPKIIKCKKCGMEAPQSKKSPAICEQCHKAYINKYSHKRTNQPDWIEIAQDSGLDPWALQPGETQLEYAIWCAYRDSYPGKKPSYSDVAKQLGCAYETVKKTAHRWTFPVRMQTWIKHCDTVTLAQRRQEILDMNKEHIMMAAKLRGKLQVAINSVDPHELSPSDIVRLSKLSAELERKARVDTIAQDEMRRQLLVDTDNPELKKGKIKKDSIEDVLSVLAQTGVFDKAAQTVGVRQTTEVVLKEDDSHIINVDMDNENENDDELEF